MRRTGKDSCCGLKEKIFPFAFITLLVFASIAIPCVSGVQYSANVIAEDTMPPIVTDPSANPSSIAADGAQESQLNVTVADESGIYSVTVDLSALGGAEAKEMVKIDSNVYTTTTAAAIGKPPGTYYLRVNATDDSTNRNSNTSVSIQLTVTSPLYAIWANSTTHKHAIQWSGSRNMVNGNVHSNNDIRVSGSSNMIIGTTEYVSTFTDSGSNNTFIPLPIKVAPEPFPIRYNIEDYKPGGTEAIAAETEGKDKYHYFDKKFHVSGSDVVLDGLYYVEGDAKLSGSNISGVFTIVAEGKIDVSGSEHNCSAYSGNLLFFSNNTEFKIAGGKSYFGGIIYIPKGEIEISGAKNTINGGLFADTVKLSGSELNINAAHLNLKSTVETTQTSGDNINIFIKALKAILQFFRVK